MNKLSCVMVLNDIENKDKMYVITFTANNWTQSGDLS